MGSSSILIPQPTGRKDCPFCSGAGVFEYLLPAKKKFEDPTYTWIRADCYCMKEGAELQVQ